DADRGRAAPVPAAGRRRGPDRGRAPPVAGGGRGHRSREPAAVRGRDGEGGRR
ncbi:MAG: Dihydrolipoamide acyltransferase component of branched-chain alpha-keto acid dehydrogenase complex, partial [uncultured Nocardioidaceae bacterium]